ncbi:hypothetical protein EI969_04850 [Pseudomonas sp. PB101]|nr:hypothetical protein [Pseudomonas sp. PB101]
MRFNEVSQTPSIPVGASLLAMADQQSTSILNVMAPSRASSLPQYFRGVYSPVATPRAGSLIHSLHEPAYNEPNG